jgi:hypothetical protein
MSLRRCPSAVAVGRVEQVDAEIEGPGYDLVRGLLVDLPAEVVAAESYGRHAQAGAADLTLLHVEISI